MDSIRGLHILLVDDEEEVVAVAASSLEAMGAESRRRLKASKPCGFFLNDPYRFDVSVIDEAMPDLRVRTRPSVPASPSRFSGTPPCRVRSPRNDQKNRGPRYSRHLQAGHVAELEQAIMKALARAGRKVGPGGQGRR